MKPAEAHTRETDKTQTRQGFRSDIQGLRALAVLVVFADHLWRWPTGGFVGVDIFFVLSGFLITGILLRELELTGRIDFVRFYIRRLKRLMPAALLVIAVTCVLAWLVFFSDGARSITQDGVWAALFVANWRFVRQGTDYFAMGGPTSPLQHYWSLSVEEQFYFVWPWLLLLAALIAVHVFRKQAYVRPVAAVVIGVISVGSFVLAMVQSADAPVVAYFSTLTQTWELGAGALLAIASPVVVRLGARMRVALAYSGIAAMLGSIFFLSPDLPFPGPWAALPVAGALLMIASGVGQESRHLGAFTNRVATYIGNISYSLYLWHFPAIVFGSILFSGLGALAPVAVILVAFGAAIASYHLVEQPVLRSPWLAGIPKPERKATWSGWRQQWGPSMKRASAGALTTVLVTAGLTLVTVVSEDASLQRATESSTSEATELVREAAGAAAFPAEVVAQFDSVSTDVPATYPTKAGCFNPASESDTAECRFGSGERSALVLGDSYAAASLPPIVEALDEEGYATTGKAFSSCAVSTAPLDWADNPARQDACNDFYENLSSMLDREQPDLVVILDSETAYNSILVEGTDRQTAWYEGRRAALETITSKVEEVLIIHPNPRGASLEACANKVTSSAEACSAEVSQSWRDKVAADESLAAEMGLATVDTLDLFCADFVCPAFAGDVVQRFDTGHLTASYLELVGPDIRARVQAALRE